MATASQGKEGAEDGSNERDGALQKGMGDGITSLGLDVVLLVLFLGFPLRFGDRCPQGLLPFA